MICSSLFISSSMLEASGPVQEAGLYARIGTGRRSSVLSGWRRLDIVLAIQPEPLDDLNRVLLMFARVGVSGLKERRGRLDRCVHSFN